MKHHCPECGGKMKFYGILRSCPDPPILRLRWYKFTQCGYKMWIKCNNK